MSTKIHLFTAQALVHLCKSYDTETLRFALLTLELLAIESPDVVCAQVRNKESKRDQDTGHYIKVCQTDRWRNRWMTDGEMIYMCQPAHVGNKQMP